MTTQLAYTTWQGGPHLLLPEVAVPLWKATGPPRDARIVNAAFRAIRPGPATDYDRACDVNGLVGVIPVGPHDALVVGDEVPMSALVWTHDGLLCVFVPMTWKTESSFAVPQNVAAALQHMRIAFEVTDCRFRHAGGRVVLMPAAETDAYPIAPRLTAELPASAYEVWSADCDTPLGEVRAHVLRPKSGV